MNIGTKIKEARTSLSITQEQAAEQLIKGGNAPLWHTDFACKV